MAILPFKIKQTSEKRSEENQNLLVSKIIEQVVKEVRMFIPAPIPGEKGERGEQGERGERGIEGNTGARGETGITGLNGRDGKDGKDGEDAVLDTVTINELLLPHIESLRNEIKRIRQKGGGGSSSTPASSITVATPPETPDAVITQFTVTGQPKWVVADGIVYFEGIGYSYGALTITLDIPPSQSIRVIL